jgi:ABC-2 type transport system ATP-binding protein
MTAVLSVHDVTISRGSTPVVRGVSFDIHAGEILGLIGPNGAGKSTTIGGLLGYYPVTGGQMAFRGQPYTFGDGKEIPFEVKRKFAYIPEQPVYYADLTLAEHLEWKMRLWELAGGSDAAVHARMEDLVHQLQLEPHLSKFPHQCSKGTLQKLMVVSAFLFPFDVLIVDEPFIGLDVIAIRQVREWIERARLDGAAVLLSTHVLDSAERMCQRFAFMMDGEVFAAGSLEELRAAQGNAAASLEDLFIALFHARRAVQP